MSEFSHQVVDHKYTHCLSIIENKAAEATGDAEDQGIFNRILSSTGVLSIFGSTTAKETSNKERASSEDMATKGSSTGSSKSKSSHQITAQDSGVVSILLTKHDPLKRTIIFVRIYPTVWYLQDPGDSSSQEPVQYNTGEDGQR